MRSNLLLVVSATAPLLARATESVTEKNWRNHPEIEKIRLIYDQVNTEKDAGRYKKQSRKCQLNGGAFEIEGTLYTDPNGVVRKYEIRAGTGDSAGTAEYYYNAKGVSRFTYRTRSSYYGGKTIDRIYMDNESHWLYTDHREEQGGVPGSELSESISNPAGDFADLCKE